MDSREKDSNKVFRPDKDWWNNACLSIRDRDPYITGYLRAGELLVAHVVDQSRDQDTLLYPIVFIYRHALELLFKEIIESGRLLLDEQSVDVRGHRIEILWPQARDILTKIWKNEKDPPEFELITRVVNEFAEHDPSADGFRYPKNKKNRTNLSKLRMINVRLFSENVSECCALLDGAVCGIQEGLQLKGESQNPN
jgi:hypothetical protein